MEMATILKTQPVTLQGFLLSVDCPTDSKLQFDLDISALDWSRNGELTYKLTDVMSTIDFIYKKGALRGKGIEGRHRRLGQGKGKKPKRKNSLHFSPYPSRFSNMLGNIRAQFYKEINARCIVLQVTESGFYHEKLYLLPYGSASEFLAFVDKLNKLVEGVRREAAIYRQGVHANKVRKLLHSFLSDAKDPFEKTGGINDISANLTPVAIDQSIVEGYVDEPVKEQLRKQKQEIAAKALEHFRVRLLGHVRQLLAVKKLEEFKAVKNGLEELRKTAEDVGLRALVADVIEPLEQVADNPQIVDTVFPDGLAEAVDFRIKALLEAV